MKRVLVHTIGLIQLIVCILLVSKWLSKPTHVGPLGADNISLNILLAIPVTVLSLVSYLKMERKGLEKLVPVIIFCLTIVTIIIGVAIKEKAEEFNQPIITAELGHSGIKLFKDNRYEISFGSAEYIHFERSTYQRAAGKIILDHEVNTRTGPTNFFFINDTELYLVDHRSSDTIVYPIKY